MHFFIYALMVAVSYALLFFLVYMWESNFNQPPETGYRAHMTTAWIMATFIAVLLSILNPLEIIITIS